jgi:membrane protease YdiL (CAAX protease family)
MRKRLLPFLRGLANLVVFLAVSAGIQHVLAGRVPRRTGLVLMTAVLVLLYFAGARWIERRKVVELRLAGSARGVLSGLLLGIALFSSVMAILWIAGAYRPAGWGTWRPLAFGLLFGLSTAVSEEIIFRGFLFRLFAALGGNWTGLAVTSVFFGLAHAGNPGATPASSVAIAIEAGILLGAAYAASGALWLPIGIHAGWNFAEGFLFSMAVSGHTGPSGLIRGDLHGPTFLTGGPFGPEASVIAVLVCLALAAVYLRRMPRNPSARSIS